MVRPGYKRTEVGEIPEDWDCVALESIAHVTSGKRLPAGFTLTSMPTPFPYVRVVDMRAGTVEEADLRYVPPAAARQIDQYRIYREDLFISVAGTLGIVGRVPEALHGANLTENADRITRIGCNQSFLLNVLMSPIVQRVIESLMTVGAQPKLALGRIRKFAIPLPKTAKEQETIASALTDADGLIDLLEHLLAKKRAIKQGVMQSLLTGAKRLPGFSKPWAEVPLRDLADCHRGVSYSPTSDLSAFETDATVRLLRANNVQDNRVDIEDLQFVVNSRVHEHQRLRKDDIIVCMANGSRALVGKAAQFNEPENTPYTFGAFMGCIRPKDTSVAKFLYFTCLGDAFQKQVSVLLAGSSINNLSPGSVEGFRFAIPCDPVEQAAIAQVLTDLDADLDATTAKLHKARAIKQGMMQELLTGRIRLV